MSIAPPPPAARALQLHEILEEEYAALPRRPDEIRKSTGPGAVPEADPSKFELAAGTEFREKLNQALRQAHAHGKAVTAGSSMSADLPYLRLAQKITGSAGSGGTPAGVTASPEPPPDIKEESIAPALEEWLKADLPTAEPWLRDTPMRPFTRGLLHHHLKRHAGLGRALRYRVTGRPPAPDLLLNRLLLEDAFAEHVVRMEAPRLQAIFTKLREREGVALCLSGGGIRSATFALGIVQGLARHGYLPEITYLSTVSGGGYLGGWLSAWSYHAGFEDVTRQLVCSHTNPLTPEAVPIQHLRQYSSYLSPRLGLFSADTWTLVATYLRNLLLVWLVVLPLLAAVTMIPWLAASLVGMRAVEGYGGAGLLVFLAAVAAGLVAVAARFVHAYSPESVATATRSPDLETRRDQAAFLRSCLLPISLAMLLWAFAWNWFDRWSLDSPALLRTFHESLALDRKGAPDLASSGALVLMAGGALLHLFGWLLALPIRRQRKLGILRWIEPLLIALTGAAAGFLLLPAAKLLGMQMPSVSPNTLYVTLALPTFLFAVLITTFALEGALSRITDDAEREWLARYSAWILIIATSWLALTGIILFGPYLLRDWPKLSAFLGVGSGGLAAYLGRSQKTGGKGEGAGTTQASRSPLDLGGRLSRFSLPIATLIATVALIVALSCLDMALIRLACSWEWTRCGVSPLRFDPVRIVTVPPHIPLGVLAALTALGFFAARVVDTNRFSLHAMYRARLIRAYLGASRLPGERHPNPFTGFDETDNIHMGCAGLRGPNAPAHGAHSPPPFHVLNLALNLSGGGNLAWQERKAESFTVSPLHAGAKNLGYRPTRLDGSIKCPTPGEDSRYYAGKRGITLGTAMTISGAAASPNMGYHSSPLVTFLMTMFNARLGWWLGNPGPAGDQTFHLSAPRLAIRPIFDEMRGATNNTNEYVYLSDGGHFENLGLYEMVLRRNRFIIVSDASCDEKCTLQDLGNAIRKVRIDLGIPIEFDSRFAIRARSNDAGAPRGRYWALARIRYSCVDQHPGVQTVDPNLDGVLLYIKPGIYRGEPRDVFNYATANPAFPHESTIDQFFTESQFESYRALGAHIIDRIQNDKATPLVDLFTTAGRLKYLINFPHRVPGGPGARRPRRRT